MRACWTSLALLGACAVSLGAGAATPEDIAKAAGCTVCHALDKKTLGPSVKEIAAKYRKDTAAPARLAEHVRKGSKGIWGPAPMLPVDSAKIGDADLKAVIAWMLKS